MFKKIYEEINSLRNFLVTNFQHQNSEHTITRQLICNTSENNSSKTDRMSKTIESQQHTIEQLTNALQGKYEHGLFVITEEGKTMPTIISNGKVLTDGLISSVNIYWTPDCGPTIETEYCVEG